MITVILIWISFDDLKLVVIGFSNTKKYNFFFSNMLEITRDFYENFEVSGTYCIHVALGMTAFSLKHSKYNLL